jgi:hypothetical protein
MTFAFGAGSAIKVHVSRKAARTNADGAARSRAGRENDDRVSCNCSVFHWYVVDVLRNEVLDSSAFLLMGCIHENGKKLQTDGEAEK